MVLIQEMDSLSTFTLLELGLMSGMILLIIGSVKHIIYNAHEIYIYCILYIMHIYILYSILVTSHQQNNGHEDLTAVALSVVKSIFKFTAAVDDGVFRYVCVFLLRRMGG